jgi:hypothetical protein
MTIRSTRLVSVPAVLAYMFLTGCASVGSQPASVEEPNTKAKDPCQAQTQSAQGTAVNDPCKKTQ